MDIKIDLITYKDLLEFLKKQNDEILSQNITLCLDNIGDEFTQATVFSYQDDTVLDFGHLYIAQESNIAKGD